MSHAFTGLTLPEHLRKRAMVLAVVQGLFGAVATGLMGGLLIHFYAMELKASNVMLGLIMSAPNITGVLRLFAPYFINRSDNRKWVCLISGLIGSVINIGVPLMAFPALLPAGANPLWLLVIFSCLASIAAFVSGVAWLSWIADVVPESVWGRYFALRNICISVISFVLPLLQGWWVDTWVVNHPDQKLVGYAIVYGTGLAFAVLSIIPLLFIPNLRLRERPADRPLWTEVMMPFRDKNFRRMAMFGCWLMLASGIPQTAFSRYFKEGLGLGLTVFGYFSMISVFFSMSGNAVAGPLSDRFGNKPMIVLGLIGAATGPFFWLPATPGHWWMLPFGYVMFGFGWAFVGLCGQNLLLKIAPRGNNAAYIAAYQAVTGVCAAFCYVLGGWALDKLVAIKFELSLGFATLNCFHVFFLLSFIGRASGALFVVRILEPGARTIRYMVSVLIRARVWTSPKFFNVLPKFK